MSSQEARYSDPRGDGDHHINPAPSVLPTTKSPNTSSSELPRGVIGLPGSATGVVTIAGLRVFSGLESIIQPKVVGDSVGLSTTMTFLSLAFRAWVLGALLAIPLDLLANGLLIDIDPETGGSPHSCRAILRPREGIRRCHRSQLLRSHD